MFIATLIADGWLDDSLFNRVFGEIVEGYDPAVDPARLLSGGWIDHGYALDLHYECVPSFGATDCARFAAELRELIEAISKGAHGVDRKLDVIVQPDANREKALIVADMDSTMITVECIDELADYAGIKAQIAEVTEAAMRGELDFAEALDARVALLKGLGAEAIDRCLAERVRLMPGARTLVQTMKARGATAILVSGGFTRFAEPVGAQIGFDRVIANELLIADDVLTGAVTKPIVDSSTKETTLLGAMAELGLDASATMAVGDGANDLAMIRKAGLGVAYHAKPIVAAAAGARIDHGDLTALLYAQGIARADWVE